jgi:hypothetical protein
VFPAVIVNVIILPLCGFFAEVHRTDIMVELLKHTTMNSRIAVTIVNGQITEPDDTDLKDLHDFIRYHPPSPHHLRSNYFTPAPSAFRGFLPKAEKLRRWKWVVIFAQSAMHQYDKSKRTPFRMTIILMTHWTLANIAQRRNPVFSQP